MKIFNNKVYITCFIIVFIIILVQLCVTYLFTNTKKFSVRALIRNVSIGLCIYFYTVYKKLYVLLIPILLEIILEVAKWNGFHIEKYIATEYLYSDLLHELSIDNDSIFTGYSEGNCDSIFGFNTKDHSSENIKNISDWCEQVYKDAYDKKLAYLVDANGKKHTENIKETIDNAKFKLICDICKIKPGMKILEIGFGDGDFMRYIKKQYNINVVGVSISEKQVELVKSQGFNAYHIDFWNITPEVIGTYDLVLQCGNNEYVLCSGENPNKYTDFFKIVSSVTNENGKYFVTFIHTNSEFGKVSLYDYLRLYFLWSGNDGYYPDGKNGFTKYAKNTGLVPIHQEERTNDYYITSTLFMSYYHCRKDNKCENTISIPGLMKAIFKTIAAPYYLHSYLCYIPFSEYTWNPWLYQFIPQYKNGKWVSPETLEYILFKKQQIV
ncbi:MAG: methyltransferase domain-containing protein [Sphingomonadales bacterium]|nr:methyltransferase domain-containing protein [Sphingomonadales bacterium]